MHSIIYNRIFSFIFLYFFYKFTVFPGELDFTLN